MTKPTPTEQANPFGNLTKMLEQFKVPGVDMDAIVESRRKDMDALVAANMAAVDAIQALTAKQTEILAQTMKSIQEAALSPAGGVVGGLDLAKYNELARKAYEKAVLDMKDMAETVRKAQTEVMSGISQRASASMQEIQALTKREK
jgi:phasin family protein